MKLPANAGDARDMGLIPGSGRSPGGGHGNPLQYSCLKNPMDRGAWHVAELDTTEAIYHACTWAGLVQDTTIPGLSHPDMRV